MARNFCVFVDLKASTNPEIAIEMASKMNLNRLYTCSSSSLSNAHMVNLYSGNFPTPDLSTFMKEASKRYSLVSFSMLICRDKLINLLGDNIDPMSTSDEELILRSYLKWGEDVVNYLSGDWAFTIWAFS